MSSTKSASNALPATVLAVRASKLTPPPQRQGMIRRTSLVNRLRVGRRASVAALTAPLGYGKTTLLAEWARADDRPFAWVSIDASDDDPITFLTYVALALDRVERIDPSVMSALASPGASPDTVMALIGSSLSSLTVPVVIVLDDVHLLNDWQCLDAITVLIDHLPADSQIALASRVEPALPLARLRAEGRLVEVGAEELRLREREAGRLLAAAGVDLSPGDVAELTQRTEGWPAGLYLAALSLRATGSPQSMFRGADRFVSDYFRLELFSSLQPSRIEFLTRASVLDRMCGGLCDAVLGASGSAQVLDELEKSNLFVVPLDHERRWYRFHHLFRDMLRDELERREPEAPRTLIARAADWCEANGDIETAIDYASAAGDRERVVALVESAVLPTYWRGRFATVERWLATLDDPELLERHPAVAVFGAFAYALLGRPAEAERWADAAARERSGRPMPDGSPATAWQALLRATLCRDGSEAMLADADECVATLAPGSPWETNSLTTLGMAHLVAGDDERADERFAAAAEAGARSGASPGVAFALACRSLLATARGDGSAADALADESRETIRAEQLEDYVGSAVTYAAGARAALRRSDWVRAHDDLERADRLVSQLTYALPDVAVKVRLELARAHLSLGNLPVAAELIGEIGTILRRRPDLGVLRSEFDALQLRVEEERRADGGWEASLTPAELRLLPLLTTHLSFREIAERLYVSRNTVKTQAISVYRKLGVSSRSEAIERAVTLGLVETAGPPAQAR